jgi:hypothetical protein
MGRCEGFSRIIAVATMAAAVSGSVLPLNAQQDGREPLIVCTGRDRVLRSVKATQPCADGEKRYALAEAKSDIEDPKVVDTGEPKGTKHPSEARVSTLEEEVRQLQRELIKMNDLMYQAPFVVTDKNGKAIFVVQETAAGPSAEIRVNGVPMVQLGMGPKGNAGVRISTPAGGPAAALGAAVQGGFGGLVVFDGKTESPKAWVYGDLDGGPIVGVSKNGRTAVAALRVGKNGTPAVEVAKDDGVNVASLHPGNNGGVLQLTNAAGYTTVEAGTTNKGTGEVRAYPLGNPGAGLVGMPGTFITGRTQK